MAKVVAIIPCYNEERTIADVVARAEKHFVIVPEFPYWRDKQPDVGGKQAEIMTYASNTNKWWLTEDELKCLIGI